MIRTLLFFPLNQSLVHIVYKSVTFLFWLTEYQEQNNTLFCLLQIIKSKN